MNFWTRNAVVLVVAAALVWPLITTSMAAQTPTMFGARIGVYADQRDTFVGGEFLSPIVGRLYFNPNVEYVFVDNGTYATFNLDFHYDIPLRGPAFTWAGMGLGILYDNPEGAPGSNTDPAANVLFGVGINADGWIPYVQAKVIAASEKSDFVLGGGVKIPLE
jgi:hypothetical protein